MKRWQIAGISLIVLVLVALPFVLSLRAEPDVANESEPAPGDVESALGQPAPEPRHGSDEEPEPVEPADPESGRSGHGGGAVDRPCPEPDFPERHLDATGNMPTEDMYVFVHPEKWHHSAWCATEEVAAVAGAETWTVAFWTYDDAQARILMPEQEDDSIARAEYHVNVINDGRGWYVDSETAQIRYWCRRGAEATRCV